MKRNQTCTSKEVIEGLMNLTEEKKNVSHIPTNAENIITFLNELDTSACPMQNFSTGGIHTGRRCIKSAIGERTELSLVAIKQHCNVT